MVLGRSQQPSGLPGKGVDRAVLQLQCPVKGRRPENEAGVVGGGYGVVFHRSGSPGRREVTVPCSVIYSRLLRRVSLALRGPVGGRLVLCEHRSISQAGGAL